MPITFFSLPLELRDKIYDLALNDAAVTIYLALGYVDNNDRDHLPSGNYYRLPRHNRFRQPVGQQGRVVSLLLVSKQAYLDLASSIYSVIDFRLQRPGGLERADVIEPENHSHFIDTLTRHPSFSHLHTLTTRLLSISSPISLHRIWHEILTADPNPFPAVKRLTFYDDSKLQVDLSSDLVFMDRAKARNILYCRRRQAAIEKAERYDHDLYPLTHGLEVSVTLRIRLSFRTLLDCGITYSSTFPNKCLTPEFCTADLSTKTSPLKYHFSEEEAPWWTAG